MQQAIQNRFTRNTEASGAILGGVCSGLARSLGVDANVVRAGFVLAILFFGMSLLVYPLLWLILPREDEIIDYYQEKILGVCYQLSLKLKMELAIVRLLAVFLALLSFGSVILAYFALFIYFELKAPSQKPF